GEATEILIVGLEIHVAQAEREDLGGSLVERLRGPHDTVSEGVERRPVIVHLDRQDHVGLADHDVAPERLVERMAGREVGAPEPVHHRALQDLGEFNETVHAGLGARHAVTTMSGAAALTSSFATSAMAPESA